MSEVNETLWLKVQLWQQRLDALQARERVLLFAVAVVLLVSIMQMLLIEPVLKKTAQIKKQHQQAQTVISQKKSEKQQLELLLAAGVNRAKIAKRDKLKQEFDLLETKIQSSLLTLIPPKLMPQVLEKVLLENDKLRLMSLENRPVVALIKQQPEQTAKKPADAVTIKTDTQGLFKHSFVIQLEGSYPAAIDYFEALSELPWRFNWDSLHYQVTQYPRASISLEVHTVSLSEDWIGV